jgi:hypothetical protein
MQEKKYSKTCVPSLSRAHKRNNKRLANKRLRKQWHEIWVANAEYRDAISDTFSNNVCTDT